MKAIVTGSCGFIGYNMCRELIKRKHHVLGIDDLSTGRKKNTVKTAKYKYFKVQDRQKLNENIKEFKPDIIFHLAARPRVSFSVENPYLTAEANVMATISLLETVVKAKIKTRIINSSSSSVYGGADVLPTPEEYSCSPKSPYALEKYQGEQWCKMFANIFKVDVLSLRYFNVFGPEMLFGGAYSTVLAAWLYHIYIDETYEPFLEGDGYQSRDFCYVDNVVQANLKAAESSYVFKGEEFNIAQGQAHTLLECKEIIEKLAGKKMNLAKKSERVGDVRHTLADISKAKKIISYAPENDFSSQVKITAEWYKNNYPRK